MARILKLSDRKLKTTLINMLRALIDTDMREQMDSVNREVEILRKYQKC